VVGDHADVDAMRGIGAREGVDDVEGGLRAEMRGDLVAQVLVRVLRELLIDVAPPDPVLRAWLADDELVLRRAPGVDARIDRQRAALGELPSSAKERMRVEDGRAGVPVDVTVGVETVLLEPCTSLDLGHRHTRLLPRTGAIVFTNGPETTEGPLRERALQSFV